MWDAHGKSERSNIREIGVIEREERENTVKSRFAKESPEKQKEANHLTSAFRFSEM